MTDLLTAEEVAERLAVRPNTVLRWATAGKIPAVRLGARTIRFEWDAVRAAFLKLSKAVDEE
jgi:excisionase family DNA binding protein